MHAGTFDHYTPYIITERDDIYILYPTLRSTRTLSNHRNNHGPSPSTSPALPSGEPPSSAVRSSSRCVMEAHVGKIVVLRAWPLVLLFPPLQPRTSRLTMTTSLHGTDRYNRPSRLQRQKHPHEPEAMKRLFGTRAIAPPGPTTVRSAFVITPDFLGRINVSMMVA